MKKSILLNRSIQSLMIVAVPILSMFLFTACDNSPDELTLSTTTSTENSGLLAEILPHFEEDHNMEVKVVAVGTGAALDMGREKDADVLLVHALELEEEFVSEGYGTERSAVMYNDFVLIGPMDDPANLMQEAPDNVTDALTLIWESEAQFVSRGDNSGTHTKELNLVEEAGLSTDEDFYVSAGQGMGAVIEMADELEAYTLADRGTYLSMKDDLDLQVVTEGDERLFNPYGVIPVTQDEDESLNLEGAQAFAEWITSSEVQEMIGEFGVEEFGEPLFIPNAD